LYEIESTPDVAKRAEKWQFCNLQLNNDELTINKVCLVIWKCKHLSNVGQILTRSGCFFYTCCVVVQIV